MEFQWKPQHDDAEQAYMRSLFDYGYGKGREGYAWQKVPPGYAQ